MRCSGPRNVISLPGLGVTRWRRRLSWKDGPERTSCGIAGGAKQVLSSNEQVLYGIFGTLARQILSAT